jgi:serine/threonine protein kinase
MQYPLISEYVRAICHANDNLDALNFLEPVMDNHGEPLHSSGAFAVVFKMKDTNVKSFALKCFTTEQQDREEAYTKITEELEKNDSPYLMSVKYYNKELFVDSKCTSETEFPVLLMDWIEGETLETYILSNYAEHKLMSELAYRFCEMAAWLHSQIFAHGDIKPDNIMVKPNGNLVLIDYDGMYVPSMNGQKAPILGSRNLSHPLRSSTDFNETIDDFSLAAISLSLYAISLDQSLFEEYGNSDGMLFSYSDYLNLSKSKSLMAITKYFSDTDFCKLYGNLLLAYSQKDLSLHSFRNFLIRKPSNLE